MRRPFSGRAGRGQGRRFGFSPNQPTQAPPTQPEEAGGIGRPASSAPYDPRGNEDEGKALSGEITKGSKGGKGGYVERWESVDSPTGGKERKTTVRPNNPRLGG